jgi:hypothetical protein
MGRKTRYEKPSSFAVARMARHFVKTYGKQRLKEMIADFSASRSIGEIGEYLGVSRERVNQWRHAFGNPVDVYVVHPDIKALLTELRHLPRYQ